mmetsp:Transcript_43614/g.112720  ORF Transcript_43614/g.112720 Transcript_43614/m.112720 type:complete len:115 (+) Transcript_43614:111-455(+)
MGNVECVMHEDHAPVTHERLEWAIRTMDAKQVQRCLDAGVNVNAPIDKEGHTALDVFCCEHQHMLKESARGRGSPQEATRVFCDMQESAAAVLSVLRRNGALLSGKNHSLRRGL